MFDFLCLSFSLEVLSLFSRMFRYWCEMFIFVVREDRVKVVVLWGRLLYLFFYVILLRMSVVSLCVEIERFVCVICFRIRLVVGFMVVFFERDDVMLRVNNIFVSKNILLVVGVWILC